VHRLVAAVFADLGPGVAEAVAGESDDFGMTGFDGGFIAERGDGTPLLSQIERFARAMVAIGEANAAELSASDRQAVSSSTGGECRSWKRRSSTARIHGWRSAGCGRAARPVAGHGQAMRPPSCPAIIGTWQAVFTGG